MAQLVSLIGSTHSPWFHARTSVPGSELSAEGRRLLAWSARVQEAIQRARPDAIVILATDHFHQFFSSNMPQFIVGRMDAYQGTFSNEVREFKLPRVELRGNRALATDLIEGGFEHGFDFAFSDELRLDHACVVPSLIAQPSLDIPVVPVLTNTGAPPIPTGRRFVQLGQALRKAIEATTTVDRVAVIASGNLSQEIGGPEQMMPGPPDAEFDEDAVKWLQDRDFDRLTSEGTFTRLLSSGNGTSQFLNLVSMAAMQGDLACVVAEPGRSPRANNPCFIYEQRVQQ